MPTLDEAIDQVKATQAERDAATKEDQAADVDLKRATDVKASTAQSYTTKNDAANLALETLSQVSLASKR